MLKMQLKEKNEEADLKNKNVEGFGYPKYVSYIYDIKKLRLWHYLYLQI